MNISPHAWTGGYNYQINLFAALNKYRRGEVVPIVFAGETDNAADLAVLARIPGVEIVRSVAFDHRRAGLATALLFGIDFAAAAEFKARKVDVIFESARFFGWRLPYPAVAWLPDFQHRRLPQLFSKTARWRREIGFRAQIASGRCLMFSSESALRDCQRFYPGISNQTAVVRFATQPLSDLLTENPADAVRRYGLPSKFFYLPNQFSQHKNHGVVIDALSIIAKSRVDVVVAASGSPNDPRKPDYFDEIMRKVKRGGLENNFRYLGMIPSTHVYALMRATAGLINPSRFEGWSTTVEEAKSFGLPMILSNLDVHYEQTNGNANYFDVDDPAGLAEHLLNIWRISKPGENRNLLPNLAERVIDFAADFVRAIRCTTTAIEMHR